ncbi:MAG: hypothetical protein AAFR74_08715 [Pseudomonadota bacterium]
MRAMIFVTLLAVAGCASSLERLGEVRDAAPEWYKDRRVELAGRDYPSIANVPVVTEETRPGQRLGVSQAETMAALDALLTDPRNASVEETADEMRDWANAARGEVDRQIPVPDFLSNEEVEALKAVFDTPRGRL